MGKGLLGVIAAIVIAAAMFFSSYNGLVSMNAKCYQQMVAGGKPAAAP